MIVTLPPRGYLDAVAGDREERGEGWPQAGLSLSADVHLNALTNSYTRMHL